MFHFVYDFLLTDFDDEKLHPKYFFRNYFNNKAENKCITMIIT